MLNETTEEGGAQRLLVGAKSWEAKRLWIWGGKDLGPNDLFSSLRLFQTASPLSLEDPSMCEFVLLRKQLSSEGSLQFLTFFPALNPCARPKPQKLAIQLAVFNRTLNKLKIDLFLEATDEHQLCLQSGASNGSIP